MKTFSPSIFNAFNICKRQAWLMFRQLNADQNNEFLEIGRLIDEAAYKRNKKRIFLADMEAKIDMITKMDGNYYVAEIKKSSKTLNTGIIQLKYYLYLLKIRNGIIVKGIIKIPAEKMSQIIILKEEDEVLIKKILIDMQRVLYDEKIPEINFVKIKCKKCAYFEFCWS